MFRDHYFLYGFAGYLDKGCKRMMGRVFILISTFKIISMPIIQIIYVSTHIQNHISPAFKKSDLNPYKIIYKPRTKSFDGAGALSDEPSLESQNIWKKKQDI